LPIKTKYVNIIKKILLGGKKMAKKYISVAQASNRLNVSISTIYNYCKTGTLGYRCIKNAKRYTWQIDLESLELLEKDNSHKSILQVKKDLQYSLF
jgi:hypothetical protein